MFVKSQLQFCSKILQMEEEYVKKICNEVIAVKPDLVITEKGVSDLAQHFLVKAGISCIRRVRKSDNNRIARQVKGFVLATFNSFWENKLRESSFFMQELKIANFDLTFILGVLQIRIILICGGSIFNFGFHWSTSKIYRNE